MAGNKAWNPSSELLANNFITAVPSGASETGTIDLPPGMYTIYIIGNQTAATSDPTLELKLFTDVDQTAAKAVPLYGALYDVSSYGAAVTLSVGKDSLAIGYSLIGSVTAKIIPSFPVIHGIQYIYTKNGGTAVNLTLYAQRIG